MISYKFLQTMMSRAGLSFGLAGWLLMFLFIATAQGESRSVVHDKVSDWLSGRLNGVAVTEDGLLIPGMTAKEVSQLGVEGVNVVWSVVDDGSGGFYLGTGPEGKVVHVKKSGEVTVLADLEQAHVFALRRGFGAEVWAAASPGGVLYRLVEGEEPTKWWQGEAEYVWDIFVEEKGCVLATGRPAQLVRVSNQNESAVVCTVPDVHVRCLARNGDGVFFLGTSERGMLLSWDGKKLMPLASVDRREIRQVQVADGGKVFFIAVGDAVDDVQRSKGRGGSTSGSGGNSSLSGSSSRQGGDSFDVFRSLGGEEGGSMQRGKMDFKGDFWQWTEQSGATKVVSLPGQPHAFFADSQRVFVGVGSKGFVFSVDVERRRVSAVAQAASDYVTGFLQTSDDLIIAGSYPVSLSQLIAAQEPMFESAVVDAGTSARWGKVSVLGEAVKLERRFGWTPEPDCLWTEWTDTSESQSSQISSPRFTQYRLVPSQAGVRRVEVFYTNYNRSPLFREIRVLESGEQFEIVENPSGGPGQQSLEQLLRNEQASGSGAVGSFVSLSQKKNNEESGLGSIRVASLGGRSFRTLIFMVDDPDGDSLEFSVEARNLERGDFSLLKSGLKKPFFNFDTRGWSDGWYEFKVVAKDKPALGQEALSVESISEPVLVDNTPPDIEFLRTSDKEFTFRIKDNHSELASVEVSENGIDFRNILPKDGVVDSLEEIFSVPLEKDGVDGLFVRASDRNGNLAGGFLKSLVK